MALVGISKRRRPPDCGDVGLPEEERSKDAAFLLEPEVDETSALDMASFG